MISFIYLMDFYVGQLLFNVFISCCAAAAAAFSYFNYRKLHND